MKLRYIILIGLALIALGYILGNVIPTEYLHPTITKNEIALNDLYTRIVSIIGAIVTFLAVIAALIKEDLRKYWDFASFDISFRDESKLIELLEKASSSSMNDKSYKAKKYESILIVKNTGTIAAKSCEIYLERLQFRSNAYPTSQEIQSSSKPLNWNNNNNTSILIPASGKAYISVFELMSPSLQSVPNALPTTAPLPKIRIGETESPEDYKNGTWEARFIIYSENTKPREFVLTLKWNSTWENRLADLLKCLTIDLIIGGQSK